MAISLRSAKDTLKSMRRARSHRKRDARNAMVAIGSAGTLAYLMGRGTIPSYLGREEGATEGGVETPLAIGGVALAAGMSGVGGVKWSDDLLFGGIGLVCPGVATRLYALGVSHRTP